MVALRPRLSNSRICEADIWGWRGTAYVPVVKYPFLPHPNPDGVQFPQDHPVVDSQPPENLLPTNYRELVGQ